MGLAWYSMEKLQKSKLMKKNPIFVLSPNPCVDVVMKHHLIDFQHAPPGDSGITQTLTRSADIARNMDLIQKELERLRQENVRLQVRRRSVYC